MDNLKKLKKLKLNHLVQDTLENRHMNMIRGGNNCGCPCTYEGQPGGSTVVDNTNANHGYGYTHGYNQVCNKACVGDHYTLVVDLASRL